MAKHDKERYPDMIFANMNGTSYYTNSSHLPVGYTSDIFSALDIQDELQTLYTSGTVFHAFLGQKLPDWRAAATLVRKIAENYRLPYYTLSPTYSVCADHGYIPGEHFVCPTCGKKAEVYSRITGYYRPVQNWNDGKTQEFKDRKVYNVETSVLRREGNAIDAAADASATTSNDCCDSDCEIMLFATKTCPNCKLAKSMLDKAGIGYRVIDAEEHKDLTMAYGVKKAPTLLVPDKGGYSRYENASEIRRYIESR